MAARRVVLSLSLSRTNPDALRVLQALDDVGIAPRERSATLLAWLAAYLDGATMAQLPDAGPVLSEAELDQIMDDW